LTKKFVLENNLGRTTILLFKKRKRQSFKTLRNLNQRIFFPGEKQSLFCSLVESVKFAQKKMNLRAAKFCEKIILLSLKKINLWLYIIWERVASLRLILPEHEPSD